MTFLLTTKNNITTNNSDIATDNAAVKVGFWRRFFAISIDLFILNICISLSTSPLHKGFELGESLLLFFFTEADSEVLRRLILYITSYIIIALILGCFYFTYFHGSIGQSIGKMLFNIKVIQIHGGELTWKRAFIRWLGYFVSCFPFFLGFVWAAFDRNKQAWHDKITGTYVVRG